MTFEFARRILLCLRYGIGDLVMELPVLSALRRAAPGAHITALGARPAIELLEQDPRVDEVVSVHDFGYAHWSDWGSDETRERFRRWYRDGSFDWVLDPSHATAGVGLVLWEEPFPVIRDAGQALQAEALRTGADGPAAVRHAVAQGWGLVADEGGPRLEIDVDAQCFARVWLAGNGFEGRPVAAISPAASSPLKRWPLKRFVAAGRHLAERGWGVAVLAGPGEEGLAQAIVEGLPPGTAAGFGTRHLKQVAALLSRCGVLLCNDTGLMHLASAVGTTPVAIFGPTSPAIYAPGGAIAVGGRDPECLCRRTTEFGPPECVAQGRCLRGERPCIELAGVDEVIAALDRVIGTPPGGTSHDRGTRSQSTAEPG